MLNNGYRIMGAGRYTEAVEVTHFMVYDRNTIDEVQCIVWAGFQALPRSLALFAIDKDFHQDPSSEEWFIL